MSDTTRTGDAKLLYHRLMLPNWLCTNAEWNCSYAGSNLDLIVEKDSSNWANIFRVRLIPPGVMCNEEDITVKMRVGVGSLEPPKPRYPMPYMISDGNFSVGIELWDPKHPDVQHGLYKAVNGASTKAKLQNPYPAVEASVRSTSINNPDQFVLSFKPSEPFGSAYCAIDYGHKILAKYSDTLKLSNGLTLELYRRESTDIYIINYIEITVYKDSEKI